MFISTSTRYKQGLITLDATELDDRLAKLDDGLKQLVTSKEVLTKMAASVIMSASDSGLIPEKLSYRIKRPKKLPYKRDSKGKVVTYKSGKKKGQPKFTKFNPSMYYSVKRIEASAEPITVDTRVKRTRVSNVSTGKTKTKVTALHQSKDGIVADKQISKMMTKRKSTYYSGSGTITTGYVQPVKKYHMVREHWTETKGAYATYNKEYFADTQTTVGKKGRSYTNTSYFADRPPHLSDVDVSHKIRIHKGKAQILVQNKKPRDRRFSEEGGIQYGAFQYFAPDATWNRETEGTTSRWLEVAMGLPVPASTKIQSIPTAEANRAAMMQIMGKALKAKLKNI